MNKTPQEKKYGRENKCAFLFLTSKCNLACKHCYLSAQKEDGKDMSSKIFDRSLKIFEVIRITDIRFTGGEPTIHPNFMEWVNTAFEKGFKVGLVTNGKRFCNLKPKKLEWLSKILSRCWISGYGPSESIHEKMTKCSAPSLENLISIVIKLDQYNCKSGLSITMPPSSTSKVIPLLREVARLGVTRVRFIPLQPDGRARKKLSFKWEDWPNELNKLHKILLKTPLSKEFEVLRLNNLFNLDESFEFNLNSCLLNHREMWTVNSEGDIYPCCFTVLESDKKIGNIKKVDIHQKLANYDLNGVSPCRAFTNSFWPGISEDTITCPISSINYGDDNEKQYKQFNEES